MTQPCKFIVAIELVPGTQDEILARAPEVQLATRAENGCLSFDCFTRTDNPDRLVFIESWEDAQAHAEHLLKDHTQRFLEFHEPLHRSFNFETITVNT
ncbi:MAG TPA: putative quinol monooxygenase [Rhizobium sp.]